MSRPSRVLVAGIGNIFLGDDGFGVEVARRMAQQPVPEHVEVVDAGIRGMHLALQIAYERYDAVILVDAVPRGHAPGTLYVIDPDPVAADGVAVADGHTMTPDLLLAWLRKAGCAPSRITIVGCEPASLEPALGLSEVITSRLDAAVDLVRDVIDRLDERAASCA